MCCLPLQGYDRRIYRRLNLLLNVLNLPVLFGCSRLYKDFCKRKDLQALDEDYAVGLCARVSVSSTLVARLFITVTETPMNFSSLKNQNFWLGVAVITIVLVLIFN